MTVALDQLLVNERGIAFDPATGEMYRLIGPAYALVRHCSTARRRTNCSAICLRNTRSMSPRRAAISMPFT
jgi:hypothetical protein